MPVLDAPEDEFDMKHMKDLETERGADGLDLSDENSLGKTKRKDIRLDTEGENNMNCM